MHEPRIREDFSDEGALIAAYLCSVVAPFGLNIGRRSQVMGVQRNGANEILAEALPILRMCLRWDAVTPGAPRSEGN
jgi:hypothetical protein